jgi:hypothetical protein
MLLRLRAQRSCLPPERQKAPPARLLDRDSRWIEELDLGREAASNTASGQ